jgi:hypothetical protein
MHCTPTLEEFLAASIEEVRQGVPETVILGAGGTRRRAVLAGMAPQSEAYIKWTRQQMIACLSLLFRYGVKHILTPLLVHSHQNEKTPGYSDRIVEWIRWGLASGPSLREFNRLGWLVRLIGAESWEGLEDVDTKIRLATAGNSGPTVWFTVLSNAEAHWELILRTACEHNASTRQELVHLLYGEDIPQATLYIGSGKPQVVESIVPPLLIGKLECYWRQHLGYDLDERTLRAILYDYAYVRRPTPMNKTGRAERIVEYAGAWDEPPIIGMGMRLGPFWYPTPVPAPHLFEMETV